ncbi:MAG: hypothetical protein Q8R18_05320 [bacterium]|nr:hypothetical protein [bacterium]
MKRGTLLFVFTLLLTVAMASADEGISFTEINSTTIIFPGELGQYTLLLKNEGARELKIQIQAEAYAGLPSSDFDYVFVEPSYVELQGHEETEVIVSIKLKEDVVRQKRYKTYITAEALNLDGISTLYDLQVFAMPPQSAISATLSESAERVGPGGDLSIDVHLKNNLMQDLSNVDVYISSDLFEDQQTIELFKNQEKDLEFIFTIPRSAAPKEYSFNVRLYYEDELSGSVSGDFIVDENLNVSEYNEIVSGFLYETRTVTISNNGNSVISDFYDQDPGLFERWFTGYSAEPSYDNELGQATWTFTLAPEEKFVLVSDEDYRPLLVGIIVVLLLGFIMYYIFTKRVIIKKETFKLKYSTDGVSEFKVLLHLKNNTNKAIKDITIIDVLPKLIQPKTNFGTLHPSGIERGDKGIRIMWKIPELVSGEERIISYEVDAQFKVIGDISLPKATVKYKNKNNRATHISSNSAKVVSGIVESPEEEYPRKKK